MYFWISNYLTHWFVTNFMYTQSYKTTLDTCISAVIVRIGRSWSFDVHTFYMQERDAITCRVLLEVHTICGSNSGYLYYICDERHTLHLQVFRQNNRIGMIRCVLYKVPHPLLWDGAIVYITIPQGGKIPDFDRYFLASGLGSDTL